MSSQGGPVKTDTQEKNGLVRVEAEWGDAATRQAMPETAPTPGSEEKEGSILP